MARRGAASSYLFDAQRNGRALREMQKFQGLFSSCSHYHLMVAGATSWENESPKKERFQYDSDPMKTAKGT